MSSQSKSRGDAASPAPARTLLRISRGFGRNASRAPGDSGWRRIERAASRGIGRAGHWLDRRNPQGLRRVASTKTGLWLLAGTLIVGVGALLARQGRRRG